MIRALAVAVVVSAASIALAQDGGAPAQPKSQRATVRLHTGGSMKGVVMGESVWERQDATGQWVAAKSDDAGAGVRVWYPNGLDGFVFLGSARVAEVAIEGAFTDADLRRQRSETDKANKQAEAERQRIAADKRRREQEAKGTPAKGDAAKGRDAKGDAAKGDAAKGDAAKGDAAKGDPAKPEAAKPDPSRAEQKKRWGELLAKYPPAKWKLTTPDDLQKRFIVNHLPATEEERAFIAVYAEWKAAYEDWLLTNPM